MRFLLCSLFALTVLFLGLFPNNALAAKAIGKITKVVNEATIKHAGEDQATPAKIDDPVFLGDTLYTKNETSFVRVDFIDETHITMNAADAELVIDEYIFDPQNAAHNAAKFTVLKGTFEFVGGLIENGEENVQINLDFGSIGVRGTKVLRSMKDGECWIYLEDGEVRVYNDGGSVDLKPGDGTRMSAKDVAPREVEPWTQKQIDWIKRVSTLPE